MKPRVEKMICAHFGVSLKALHGRGRWQPLAHARQVAYWIFREVFQMTGPGIAEFFERDNPSTIYKGIRNVLGQMDAYPKIHDELLSLRANVMATITHQPFP